MKLIATLLTTAALLCAASSTPAQVRGNNGYDPVADPVAALQAGQAQANASGKLVLVEAGGAWCRWCWAIDAFLRNNPDVQAEFDTRFVRVKVYWGDENQNRAFFATLPKAKGYPHFWILSADGKLIESVNTGTLEDGKDGKDGYDRERFLQFIRQSR